VCEELFQETSVACSKPSPSVEIFATWSTFEGGLKATYNPGRRLLAGPEVAPLPGDPSCGSKPARHIADRAYMLWRMREIRTRRRRR
jgi:hypothetical protein